MIDKETPMIPLYKELLDESKNYEWVCGRCKKKHFSRNDINYCNYCGQKIDWINDTYIEEEDK